MVCHILISNNRPLSHDLDLEMTFALYLKPFPTEMSKSIERPKDKVISMLDQGHLKAKDQVPILDSKTIWRVIRSW